MVQITSLQFYDLEQKKCIKYIIKTSANILLYPNKIQMIFVMFYYFICILSVAKGPTLATLKAILISLGIVQKFKH